MSGHATEGQGDSALAAIRDLAISATGMSFLAARHESVLAAVRRRMEVLGVPSASAYLDSLVGEPGAPEREALIDELTIGETYFFRHQAQWQAFVDVVVPDLLSRNRPTRRLSIWSAGCSNGAEAYTAAILMRDRFAAETRGWRISVTGTDINRRFLAAARRARFGRWSFRATPEDVWERCFTAHGREWELNQEYREGVEFRRHNLVRDGVPDDVAPDLILCRNLLIYFDAETSRRVVDDLHRALPVGGWLLVGPAEANPQLFGAFHPVRVSGAVLHRKEAEPRPPRSALVTAAVRPNPRAGAAAPVSVRAHACVDRAVPRAGPCETVRPETRPVDASAPARSAFPTEAAGSDPSRSSLPLLVGRGEWARAWRVCLDWLEQEPMSAEAHFYQGLIFDLQGRPDRAAAGYGRALYLDPSLAAAHYQLGCVLRNRGDARGARRCFRNVLSLLAEPRDLASGQATPALTIADLRGAAEIQMRLLDPAAATAR